MPARSPRKIARRGAASAARAAAELRALEDLRTVVGSARQHDARVRRAAGISGSQLWALDEVAHAEGITVNELAARLALHQTTASNLVNALVARRLMRRARDRADQRIVHLHVTAEGTRLLARAPQPCSGLLVDALRRLAARDLDKLSRSLALLLGEMRQAAPAAAGEFFIAE
ncbi:MAG: MarR family transcriptional regulator [Gammaproteobacteria bacterium]|nr:MarR family transcriptional regulator [Gammaproteobacteria bacterium]